MTPAAPAALLLAWAAVAAAAPPPPPDVQLSTEPYVLPVSTEPGALRYLSDELSYDRPKGLLRLHGKVKLEDDAWTLKSDEVLLDLEERTGRALGYVLLEDGTSAVWGDQATVDFEAGSAELFGASGGYRPWFVQARRLSVAKDAPHVYRGVRFTSCSGVPDPHYHFRASRMTVRPKESVSATNVLLFAGGVPVFWLPYFYHSLAPDPFLRTTFKLGYSGRNGAEVKSTTHLRFSPEAYGRLYVDAYTSQGLGLGGELDLNAEELARGNLYGYEIKDESGERRWTLLGNHYQRMDERWSAQARLEMLSDPQFNNDFFRSNFFRVRPDLRNSFALTRQTPNLTARLSAERLDLDTGGRFLRQDQTEPRLDLASARLGLPLGFGMSFSGFGMRQYLRGEDNVHDELGATAFLDRNFRFGRRWTLVPRAFLTENWRDELQASPDPDALVSRYGGGALLRFSSLAGDLDLDYDHRLRSRRDGFGIERTASDRGVEASKLTAVNFWRPHRAAYARVSTGYDFRSFAGRSVSVPARFDPLRTELSLTPADAVSVSVVDQFDFSVGRHQSTLAQLDFGDPEGDRVGFGWFRSEDEPERHLLSHVASWGRRSWRLTGALRYELDLEDKPDSGVRFFEKAVLLEKDFHDFQTAWEYRDRTRATEVHFRVHLRFSYDEAPKRAPGGEEWYPWRRGPDDR